MRDDYFMMFPNMEYEERLFVEQITERLTEDEMKRFVMMYQSRRQDSQNVLIFTLLGFVGISGIQRFIVGDIALGILYLFTAGLCFIGTIVDLVNYKSITINYNRKKAMEVMNMMSIQINRRKE